MKDSKLLVTCTVLFFLGLKTQAEDEKYTAKDQVSLFYLDKEKMFKPNVIIETWATYSSGEQQSSVACNEHSDIHLRRFRFGACGQPYSFLKYSFQMHFDRIGEDNFASTKGTYKGIGLWNAYITAKLLKNNDLLNVHFGYFWAAVSRDFMTSPWAVGSFDKSYSTCYLRHFITGAGNGIASGVALGGIKNFEKTSLSYRVGTYEPETYLSAEHANRLYTGRLMFSVGDPEQTKYKYMLSGNHWSQRDGVTFGVGASTQQDGKLSEILFFNHSRTWGGDILINYAGLNLTGEYYLMDRTAGGYEHFEASMINIRAGYNLKFKSTFIEPNISFDQYQASGAKELYKFVGDDRTFDVGVNWYLNKDKLKLALHYVMQEGSTASNIGDYLGLACQFKL